MVGYRRVMRENSISVQGPRLWSSLSKFIQDIYTIAIFKHELFFINAYEDELWMSFEN